uniref:CSON002666 protein n=1 Tax=Culicoides sonorensis TaxID=179676 RepID=A0A336LW13_CULSO
MEIKVRENLTETLVIETTPSDFPEIEFYENDPLADPLSIVPNASSVIEKNPIESPCERIEKTVPENTVNNDEKDSVRLVDVQALKIKTEMNKNEKEDEKSEIKEIKEIKVSSKKTHIIDDEKPSCSKYSAQMGPRPPTPNYELDDLEELIQSSRICVNKQSTLVTNSKTEPNPIQNVSEQEKVLEIPIKNENDQKLDQNTVKSEIKHEKPSIESIFEDFEDQIEQSILNKSELTKTESIKNIETPKKSENLDEKSVIKEKLKLNESKTETQTLVKQASSSIPSQIKSETKIETKSVKEIEIVEKSIVNEQSKESKVIENDFNEPEIRVNNHIDAIQDQNEKKDNEILIDSNSIQLEIVQNNELVNENETPKEFPDTIIVESIDMIKETLPEPTTSTNSSNIVNFVNQELESLSAIVDTIHESVPVIPLQNEVPMRDEEDGGVRSDGSDSGLGSEPSTNTSALSEKSLTHTRLPDPPAKGNLKRRSSEQIDSSSGIETKRNKKGIQFEGVTVYSFPRIQGFSCVPSQGGCTLGMANQHCNVKYYSLAEHSAEQRRNHRQQLSSDLQNGRSSSSDESESEYEPSDSSSEADSEVYGFLQPVSARQRRALLKSAGVRKIDSTEKDECKMIRTSREVCGCTCRVYCDPDTCACSLAGIKCQVDRPNFPCGCTRDGCANVVGRVEFSPMRVRTHYIHTVMKLQMENKQERLRSSTNAASAASTSSYKAWQQQQQQQTQSNIRQVPSTSSASSCVVDGIPSQQTQHCDFGLIYDNTHSNSTPEMSNTAQNYTYHQNDATSYTNHIIDYNPKPSTSTSYPSTTTYDPNNAYITYPEQYLQETVTYETNAYQLHSYDINATTSTHHQYEIQPQIQYQTTTQPYTTNDSQYCLQSPQPQLLPSIVNQQIMPDLMITNMRSSPQHTDHLYHNHHTNGYQIQLPSENLYNSTTAIAPPIQHYIEPPQVIQQMTPNKSLLLENGAHTSVGNGLNDVQSHNTLNGSSISNPNNGNSTGSMQSYTNVQNNNNENLCEIIKKGIVETVSG